MHETVKKVFFALISFDLNGTDIPNDLKNLITPEILPILLDLSKRHDLAHIVGDALDKNGLLPDDAEIKKHFLRERDLAVYRYIQQQYDLEQICMLLENSKIQFIPLKGCVFRSLYPEPWMRTSCDIDILVKKDDLKTALDLLSDKLGFVAKKQPSINEWSMFTPGGVHVELHYDLTEGEKYGKEILTDIWQYTIPIREGSYHLLLTDTVFYFYHIAHMVKHFENGGCGIRPFLDLWIFQSKVTLNQNDKKQLLELGNLLKFSQASEKLVGSWFESKQENHLSSQIEEYIFSGGSFGKKSNRIGMQQAKNGTRAKYFLSRIFISNKKLKIKYPILQKHPFLTPFYHIVRWSKPIWDKKVRNKSLDELSISSLIEKSHQESMGELLIKLGLK